MAYPGRRETPYTSTDYSVPGYEEPRSRRGSFFEGMGSQRKKVEDWMGPTGHPDDPAMKWLRGES